MGVSPLWVYAGVVKLRSSSGRLYIHLPPRVVEAIGAKHVVLRAVIEPVEGCEPRVRWPLGDLVFKATLVRVNGTYRVNVPQKISKALAGLGECVVLHIFVTPYAVKP
jgi:hypothetical protein